MTHQRVSEICPSITIKALMNPNHSRLELKPKESSTIMISKWKKLSANQIELTHLKYLATIQSKVETARKLWSLVLSEKLSNHIKKIVQTHQLKVRNNNKAWTGKAQKTTCMALKSKVTTTVTTPIESRRIPTRKTNHSTLQSSTRTSKISKNFQEIT